MRKGWWLALAIVSAGCVEIADLEPVTEVTRFSSALPSFSQGAVYPVLLADGRPEGHRAAALGCLAIARAPTPFQTPELVVNDPPYDWPPCWSRPVADLAEGRLLVNRSKFLAAAPAGVVVHGSVPSRATDPSRCCLAYSFLSNQTPWKLALAGRNYSATLLEDGGFRIVGEGIEPLVLRPGEGVELVVTVAAPQGNQPYRIRFETPGTWSSERVGDPNDEWVPCAEPRGYRCHASWNGRPPPDRWGGSTAATTHYFVPLHSNAHNLPTLLANLTQGWLPWGSLERVQFGSLAVQFREGKPWNVTFEAYNGTSQFTGTRHVGGPCRSPSSDLQGHCQAFGEDELVVRVTVRPRSYRPSVADFTTFEWFRDLSFDALRERSFGDAPFNLTIVREHPFGYDWSNEAAARAKGGNPAYPHVWIRNEEPVGGLDWRLVRTAMPKFSDSPVPMLRADAANSYAWVWFYNARPTA